MVYTAVLLHGTSIFEFYYVFWIWQETGTHTTSPWLTNFSLCLSSFPSLLSLREPFVFFFFFPYIFDAHIHPDTDTTQPNILFVSISTHCVHINSDNSTATKRQQTQKAAVKSHCREKFSSVPDSRHKWFNWGSVDGGGFHDYEHTQTRNTHTHAHI